MTTYTLRFPRDLSAESVTAMFGALSPALSGRGSITRLSVVGSNGAVEHLISIAGARERRVLGVLRSSLPSVRIDVLHPHPLAEPPTHAVELRLSTAKRPMRIDRAAPISSHMLTVLCLSGAHERVEMQWLLTGALTPRPPRHLTAHSQPRSLLVDPSTSWHAESEELRQHRQKQREPLFMATARIAVWTDTPHRARALVGDAVRALAAANAPGAEIRLRSIPSWWTVRRFMAGTTPWFDWPIVVNAAELTSLIGWPIESPLVPGLSLGTSRQLPPSRTLSRNIRRGPVLADSTFPGAERPIVLPDHDRLMHTHVLGPTGSGKSVLLGHIGASDIERGNGLIAIDPRGDFVDYLADRVPEGRESDIIMVDPADSSPVGYNPLRCRAGTEHLVVDQLDHIFSRLFGGNYGPRSGDIHRACLLTLLAAGRSKPAAERLTLAEVPLLLTNESFRRSLSLDLDPQVVAFWQWFDGLGGGQAAVVAPLLNKYRSLLLREPVRRILGQADPGWSMAQAFTERKIILIRLSAGEIGEEAAQLLGSILVAGIWQAAQARTRIPSAQRRPTMLLIDEFQNYVRLPTSLGDMLAQARGLGLGITLANQQLGQLGSEMQAEVLANARSRVVFQTNAKDARTLAPHLPGLTPEDLQHLGPFEVAMQLAVGSNLAPVVTAQTRRPLKPAGRAEYIKQLSRERHGRNASEIDAELRSRWERRQPRYVLGEIERSGTSETAS